MSKNIELLQSQQNLWYAHQTTDNKSLYNVSFAYKILGSISSEIIKDCFYKIWISYPELRIKIIYDQAILSTNILDKNKFLFDEITTKFDYNKKLVEFFVKISQKPFLLNGDLLFDEPLIRFYIINNKNDKYLLIVAHHILTNAQFENIIIQKVKYYLENYKNGEVILKNDSLCYNEGNILLDDYNKNNLFWKDFLQHYSSSATIPYDFKSDPERDFIGRTLLFDLDVNLSNKIINFCYTNNSTVFIFMLSCMSILISRYSNSNDIIIGTPVSLEDNNNFIFNVNVLPIRLNLSMEQDFLSILSNVKKNFLICLENRNFNTKDLTKKLHNHYPNDYVKVALVQNYNNETNITVNKDLLQKIGVPNNTAKFDFLIGFSITNNNLQILIEYSKKFYKRKTIFSVKNNLIKIINSVIEKKSEPLKSIELLSLSEITKQKKCLTGSFKDSQITLYKDFDYCTKIYQDTVAVIFGDEKLSYIQAKELTNKLANYFLEFKSTYVIVLLKPNVYLPSLILAIFKAGKIYVPIDVEWPEKRIKSIIRKFNSSLLITDLKIDFVEKYIHKVSLSNLIKFSNNKPTILEKVCEQEIAYILHTSGTTGTPKGVVVSHASLNNLLQSLKFKYSFSIGECLIQNISLSFDPSLWAIFWPLMTGGTTIIIDNTQRKDPSYQIDLIVKYGIKVFHAGPSMLTNIMNNSNSHFLKKLKFIIGGGEKWELSHLLKLFDLNKNIKLWNVYGPTETTIHVTEWIGNIKDLNGNNVIPIGSPIQNVNLLICDNNLNILPIGAKGELLIGGINLAKGYFNNIKETERNFINLKNPLNRMKIMRFYRTGDLVRVNTDGNLEYIGRNDFQVKIRGHRIELGEIESVLSSFKYIKQSVVLAREHKNIEGVLSNTKYLVGYYVSNTKLEENIIFDYLQSRLPDYMIPNILVYLENLPLKTNGKLDIKALPNPQFVDGDGYVAPRNELEENFCNIWSEVLGFSQNNKIGIRDNFFRLGGDSIVSIQLVSRFRQRLGINITVKDIFNYKTIERLYENVVSRQLINNVVSDLKTEQGVLNGEVGLLPIQQWFFDSNFAISNHWNQSFLLRTPSLDFNKLKLSIAKLIEYHDSFRLRYKIAQNSTPTNSSYYIQYYKSTAKTEELKMLDIRTLKVKEGSKKFEDKIQKIFTNWQSEFNIETGPIYSIGYIYGYEDGTSRIHFALHHLIVDTVSWRILAEDLRNIYDGKDLYTKGSSYRQWVNTIKEYKETYKNEKNYWINVLSDYNKINNKLSNLVVSENTQSFSSTSLSKEKTKELLRESNKVYNTQINDILLTGLGLALFEFTGNNINYVLLEGHGREEIDNSINITKTLGWFTTFYPVRLEVKNTIGNTIKNIKEILREIPNKGIGYGALIGYKVTELPKIAFNYLGQFDKENNVNDLENLWNITSESSGVSIHPNNIDHNIININVVVIDEILRFNISSKLNESKTIQLIKLFKQKLEEVVTYTISKSRSYLTVSDIDKIISQEYLDKLQESREIESVYLANSLQQGFIYHSLNQGSIDDAYLVQLIWQYNTKIDVDKLREAWFYAQKRYNSLRLRFDWDEELVQIIDKNGILDWRYIDLSDIQDIKMQHHRIRQIQEKDRFELYHLEQGNLFRIYLIKQKENVYTCIFSNHHAILDGWSNSILLGYVHEVYLKLKDKKEVLFLTDHSYKDSQEYLQKHQDNSYWDKYILQIEERIDLSGLLAIDNRDRSIRINEYKHIINPKEQLVKINNDLYYALKNLSQTEGLTLNAILQYAWHKVLSIYGNSNQTVVGTTISGRNLPINDIESSVGLYINTLPLIVNHKKQSDKSIIEIIKDIQDNINEINTRSAIALSKLQKEGKRIFDSLFIYENYPVQIDVEQQDKLNIKFIKGIEKLDYPLAVIAYERDNQLMLIIKYAGELFTKESIEYLLLTIKELLKQFTVNYNKGVKSLKYLNEEQYNKVIYTFNDTDNEYPSDKTIHQLFQEQVEKTPDNIALIYEKTKLTYRELNEKANQLANYIRGVTNVKADTLIGLFLDRNEYILISMLGVLKAGGAYIPIDLSYPDERIQYILKDSDVKLILTNEVHEKRLSSITNIDINYRIRIVVIDSAKIQRQLITLSTNYTITKTASTNLAYITYTSGTTGKPKGVMIMHKGVVNSCYAAIKHREITKDSKILCVASYVFDSSVLEIYPSLFSGSTLFIINEYSRKNIYLIHDYCRNHKITHLFLTTKLAEEFFNLDNSKLYLTSLVIAGEKLKAVTASKFNIINEYGPTENTVCTTYFKVLEGKSLSIGKPIYNTKCYVLNDYLKPLPIMAIGELYIGGVGIALGYLNRPDLTAERFIVNPFQSEEEKKLGKNARLYKTGDLVRWLHDGNLEFIGRNDFQIKIRGYRIELDEIETTLSTYKDIKQCAVLAKERKDVDGVLVNNKYIVGYYTSTNKLDEDKIYEYLKLRLPDYMMPSKLVYLESLPLTINGKLDKNALPEVKLINSDNYVAPRNELEKNLCKIWQDILKTKEIGINDNFFEIGGNSLTIVKLVFLINKTFSIKFSFKDIFLYPTILQLAKIIETLK